MIFWSGKGIITLLILLGGIIISQGIYEGITGLKPADQNHPLMWFSSFTVAAIGNWLFFVYLKKKPTRILVDKETNEEFAVDHMGSLFFIPIKYWTIIFSCVAVMNLISVFL